MSGGDEVAALTAQLEGCVEEWLRPYIRRLQSGELQPIELTAGPLMVHTVSA